MKDRTGIKIADQNPLTGMTSEGQLAYRNCLFVSEPFFEH